MSIIMVAVLVVTVEFALRDVNKLFNQYSEQCQHSGKSFSQVLSQPKKKVVTDQNCPAKLYEGTQALLHADVVVPIVILSILALVIVRGRKSGPIARVLKIAYTLFLLWISARIIFETEYFLIKHHQLYGKYVLLFTIIIVSLYLTVMVQRRAEKKAAA